MASYKLVYFNARGGAEVSRFIFAQAGVKYEDVRVEREEWAKLKPSTPTGKLPLLEVDGKQIPASGPMARYLAEKFGLAGCNDLENAILAGIIDVVKDFQQKLVKVFYEKDEGRKAELQKTLKEEDIPSYWGVIEGMIKKNNCGAGWVFGEKPTYADFSIYCVAEYVVMMCPDFFDKFPGIFKLKGALEALPNIAKWLKERPVTEH